VAGYFLHAWLTKSPINRDTFERIEEGMTQKDIEELIGLPPGQYERDAIFLNVPGAMHGETCESWSSNDGEIIVWVSSEGKVTDKTFNNEPVGRESTFDTLRRWLGFPREPVVIVID
jgi:hypothetical protein